ncbi:hypothetical protein EJB05_17232, partial [Eragrostis curvula]
MATRWSSPPGWRAVATDPTAANLKHNEKPVTHLASAPNLALPPHPPAAEPRPPSTPAHLALDQIPPSPSSTRRNHCSCMSRVWALRSEDGLLHDQTTIAPMSSGKICSSEALSHNGCDKGRHHMPICSEE